MNISNLATVFAPNFIRTREDGSSVSLMNDISSFNELTQTLIEQCETFI